jgi:dTDP-4-amino-4,6-dideoxygalactose transaminase
MEQKKDAVLRNIVGKENIRLVARGNKAILYALRIARKLGKRKVLIQDQGGWITYKQFPSRLKMEIVELKTDYGVVIPDELKKRADEESVLLVNSLSGYIAEQDMDTIYNICFNNKCLVINDITGSIGSEAGKTGDILVCSFGEDKPLNIGRGGLIAAENEGWFGLTQILEDDPGDELYDKLLKLEERTSYLKRINSKIKKDLQGFDIIHRERDGINVAVKFKDKKEKEVIEKYCEMRGYEYTVCPRYIRVDCDAISIEVKRL